MFTDRNKLLPSRIAVSTSLAGLAAAGFCLIDSTAVALAGDGVPYRLFPLLLVSYIFLGWVGGTTLFVLPALLARAGDEPAFRSVHVGRMQRAITAMILAIVAAVFHERLLHGQGAALGRSLSGISVATLASGCLIGAWLSRRSGTPAAPLAEFLWRVIILAAVCVLWPPFSKLYRAPWLSVTSVTWNVFYAGVALIAYFAGLRAIRSVSRPKWGFSTVGCLGITGVVGIGALIIPGVVWFIGKSEPIERDTPTATDTSAVAHMKLPNIVLIVMDTTRADHLSAYGYVKNTSPHLQTFAREALVFSHAVAPAPWTLPSHASMFTGLLPTEHGASYHPRDANGRTTRRLPDAAVTLAETLAERGYDTGGIVGNWVMLNRQYGMDQGFHYYDDRRRTTLRAVEPDVLAPSQWLCGLYQRLIGRSDDARSAEEVNECVFAWLDRPREKPFFLFINYLDPHHPYEPHPEFEDVLRASPQPGVATRANATSRRVPNEHARAVAFYDQEIAYLDFNLGRLFAKLKADGVYDSSLIIVTSDHGEAFGEHGHLHHSNSLYEEEIWVPLLIRYPSGQPRGVRHATTSLVTLSDTILAHLGIEEPALRASGGYDLRETVVSELHFAEPRTDRDQEWITRSIYIAGETKVIMDATPDGKTEVYDLAIDPCETRNLVLERTELVGSADDRLRAIATDALSRQLRPDGNTKLSDELLAQLRTLGYVTD